MAETTPQTNQFDVPTAGRYRLDPAPSSVAFRTRHLFGLARVKGTMPIIGGDIIVDPALPEADVAITLKRRPSTRATPSATATSASPSSCTSTGTRR